MNESAACVEVMVTATPPTAANARSETGRISQQPLNPHPEGHDHFASTAQVFDNRTATVKERYRIYGKLTLS